jgi:hypothetical protein
MNSFLGNKQHILNKYIRVIDFFNEADTLESRGLYYKTFYRRNLQIFVIS